MRKLGRCFGATGVYHSEVTSAMK